jgi:hypothetical protein
MSRKNALVTTLAGAALGLAYLAVSPRFAKSWLYHKKIFKN